jgi:hypothetical protein
MNKRIKELISQSYEYSTITTIDPVTQEVVTDYIDCTKPIFNKEKFAELIVRDCIGILEPKSRYMGEGPEVLKDKISQIKKHFGVEK